MPKYSEDLINDISAANDIVDYVSKYVMLKKSGKDYSGLCPFHNEKTPSFHVSSDRQLFHCFGCGASGNLIQFVMRTENLDFVDALKLLADNAGIALPEDDADFDNEYHQKKKVIFEMNKQAARFFYSQFKTEEGKKALKYLLDRQLTPKTINTYGLGYAPPSYDALLNRLRDLGYTKEQAVEASLAVERDGRVYDKFRDRVMFPIIDTRGNIIGFGGRVMNTEEKDGYKPVKYLNSSKTPVFDKGRNLFSLNLAKNSDENKIILAEGYMDVISVYQAGIKNVVATLGTAITENQAKLLSRYANEILLCYDSDEAGVKATKRAIGILTAAGVKGRVIKLKGAKDPDEYIKTNGAAAFRSCIEKAVPFTRYLISLIRTEYDLTETEGKIGFVSAAADILSGLGDAVEVDAYIKSISEETEISKDAIYSEYRKKSKKASDNAKNRPREVYARAEEKAPIQRGAAKSAEKRLLSLIVQDKKIFEAVKKVLSPEDYTGDVYKKLAQLIYDKRENGVQPEASVLLNEFNDLPDLQNEAAAVFYNMEVYSDKEATARELVKTILLGKVEREMVRYKDDGAKIKELIQKRAEIVKNPIF